MQKAFLKTKRQETRVAKRRPTDHGRITTLSSLVNHYGSSKTKETSKIGRPPLLPSLCTMLLANVTIMCRNDELSWLFTNRIS